MSEQFIELKSTEGQTLYVRKSAVGAFEVAPATAHVEGHVKIYIGAYKFLVQIEKDELLQKLDE
jgi:hypothetical protein